MPGVPRQDSITTRKYTTPESVLQVLHESRESLQEILAATGVDTSQVRATARALELDRTFVWRLGRVLSSADLLDTARDFPSQDRVEKICQACLDHGASRDQANRLRQAAAQLDDLIINSAGDRESFAIMLNGLEYDNVTQRQEGARKQAFHGNSAIWGVQARVLLKVLMVYPNRDDPNWATVCRVAGMVDLRRLRSTTWPLHRSVAYSDDGTPVQSLAKAVDREAEEQHGLPLLAAFSSDPVPEITRTQTNYGERFDLAAGAIGISSSVDCVFADVIEYGHPSRRTEVNRYTASMIDITTPAEVVISDLYLSRELTIGGEPEALLLDRVNTPRGYLPEADDRNRLPLSSHPLLLGPGAGGVATPYYPRFPQLLTDLFERLEISQQDFTGYRLLLRYPPLSTAVIIRSTLPELPPRSES